MEFLYLRYKTIFYVHWVLYSTLSSYIPFEKKYYVKPPNTHILEFMNFNGLLHSSFKNFNCLTNCTTKSMREKTSSFFIRWLWCLTTKSWPFCQRLQSSTHTHSCPGLICRDRCIDPDQIRCQSMKLSSFPLVVAVWEQKQPPTSLLTSGLKGETHAWLNFRPDHKECDLGLGRQQSLSAQQWGFRREDPRHQIASGKTRFTQEWHKVTPFLLSFLSRFQLRTTTCGLVYSVAVLSTTQESMRNIYHVLWCCVSRLSFRKQGYIHNASFLIMCHSLLQYAVNKTLVSAAYFCVTLCHLHAEPKNHPSPRPHCLFPQVRVGLMWTVCCVWKSNSGQCPDLSLQPQSAVYM